MMSTTDAAAGRRRRAARGEPGTVPSPPPASLSPSTRRVLFGPLTATAVPSAVVRRFRAAIGMGLLADGDRLPREADLAAQLGVTVFSLREALGKLREQGLVVTRAGKKGGSFVTHPPHGEDLELAELLRLTSSELRDLGDWRQMLAGQSAALAAQRASASNHTRLEAYAGQVSSAQDSLQARRAHGRFQMELSSAAQSMRMTRAEFGLHEEIDWLFSLALGTPEQREAAQEQLLAVVEAVRGHDSGDARAAAEKYTSTLVAELTRMRLATLAADSGGEPAHASGSLRNRVETFLGSVLDVLTSLAADVAPSFADERPEPDLRRAVAKAVLQRIDALPPRVDEVAVLAEVGVVPGHHYWTEAWRRTELGPRENDIHVMDPSREDFYDYELREFITEPRERHAHWAAGPYVDYGGADDYIITVAAPILGGDRFFGIAAVDFLVADLERLLVPWLASTEVVLLLNADGRVIVSNTAALRAGDIITDRAGFAEEKLPLFGWSLLTATG